MLKTLRKTFQNSVIHSICDGHGIISGYLFLLLAGRVKVWYTVDNSEWDLTDLHREHQIPFNTGKPK
jgi:hypothetical protein